MMFVVQLVKDVAFAGIVHALDNRSHLQIKLVDFNIPQTRWQPLSVFWLHTMLLSLSLSLYVKVQLVEAVCSIFKIYAHDEPYYARCYWRTVLHCSTQQSCIYSERDLVCEVPSSMHSLITFFVYTTIRKKHICLRLENWVTDFVVNASR